MTTGYVESRCTVPSSTTLSATANAVGPIAVSLTAGDYYPSDLCAHIQNALDDQQGEGPWSVALSTTTGLVTISASGQTFSITWTTAALGTFLGHSTITTQTSVTGSTACHGIFIPDRPLNLDDDPRAAPMLTDLRETESPTGFSLAVVGNARYVQTNLRWAHVSRERYLDTDSGVTPSWERFVKNTQLAQGHSWFGPRSRVKVIDQTGAAVGSLAGITNWWFRGVNRVTAKKMSDAWTGLWLIEVPALVSDGS